MSNEVMIVIALISLTLVIVGHIFIIARWSGRVDTRLEEILRQPNQWSTDLTSMGVSIRGELTTNLVAFRSELAVWVEETKRLRDARHNADGHIQRHEGKFQVYDRLAARLETYLDGPGNHDR